MCNRELENFKQWTEANRLSLNPNKTVAMIITNRKIHISPVLRYGESFIKIENSVTYLGVLIDNKLKFNYHIKNLCKKVSKSAGIIYKISQFVPYRILSSLYQSLSLLCDFNLGLYFQNSFKFPFHLSKTCDQDHQPAKPIKPYKSTVLSK